MIAKCLESDPMDARLGEECCGGSCGSTRTKSLHGQGRGHKDELMVSCWFMKQPITSSNWI